MTDRPKNTVQDAPSLGDLRKDIDRIDEAMHRLLMERGEIINRLISVKNSQETGSAFRPAREADMMRRLVQRHHGILPLDTAESIWRVIIATFTHVQAPFSVHADLSAGDAMMRDSARFHFGFTVPFVPHVGGAGVVEAVSESKGDLGLVPAFDTNRGGAWWTALEFESAPKIIARLPFIDRPDHPAPLNVFVISRVAADAMVTEVEMWSVRVAAGAPTRPAPPPRSPKSSRCRTGLSTARHCWFRCRPAAIWRRSRPHWSRPGSRCVRQPSSAATRPATRCRPASRKPTTERT